MKITGLTSNTRKFLQLDAGALYKNFVVGTDTPATAAAKLIGATVGGATCAIVPEARQISVDGAKGPTKGYEAFDSVTATLTATVKEVKTSTIMLALGAAASSTPAGVTGYTKITLNELSDSDYIDNITWIGRLSGSGDPIMIVFKNALCLNGFTLQAQDKNEGSVPLVLTAHYDVADLDEIPVDIYVPDVA